MIFARSDGGRLKLSGSAVATMDLFRQHGNGQHEAGGILLGRLMLDGKDVVIDQATPPVIQDKRSRFGFWRSREPAQRIVTRVWEDSGRVEHYLGEWHTHPEPDPTPSKYDRSEWKRLLRETRCEHSMLFFIIVGQTEIRVWEGNRSTGIIIPLGQSETLSPVDNPVNLT